MDNQTPVNQPAGSGIETDQVEKKSYLLTGYLYALMALYAVSITMIGPIMPRIIDEYGIRLSQGGLIMTFSSIGGILAILASGVAADFVRKSRLIWLSYFVFGASLFLVAYIQHYTALLIIFFIFGAGTRISDTVLNAYISDIHARKRGFFLNLLHTFFGIGAFFGPIYARYLIARGFSWNRVFSFLGIACIGLSFFMPLASRRTPEIKAEKQTNPLAHAASLRHSPMIWILCLIMFFYVGHQSSVIIWMPMYLETALLVNPTMSSLTLSFFWLGIVIGRFTCAHLTRKYSALNLLLWGSLLGGIAMAVGMILQMPMLLLAAISLAGLFTGATVPLLVTIACDLHPAHSGTASSLIFLSGSFATMIFPWLVGRLAESFSFHWAMSMTWVVFIVIILLGSPLKAYSKNKPVD